MSREKQIEEMAKYCPCYFGEKCCIDGELPEKCDMLCQFGTYAEILYNAGYRKQSEVDLYRKQVDELEDELASTYDKLENAKAEIEKLQNGLVIWKQNRFNLFQRLECYEMARQKVASEIFAEIEKVLQNEIKQYDDLFHETEDPRLKQEYICANNALEWASIKIIELKKKYEVETK